jgi:phenylacetate-coenzyme A ligase PaaK-like adenylate-forming protein
MIPQTSLINRIFSIKTEKDFENCALEIFHFQYTHNPVYREWVQHLKYNIEQIKSTQEIPFLPIQFFKTHTVICFQPNQAKMIFSSSGTTGEITSKHHVFDTTVYETSFLKCFELFYGSPRDYCVLALLPSYLEREGSSLVYMAECLIKESKHSQSGFFLNNYGELVRQIEDLKQQKQKTLLLGVSYALMDLADKGVELNEQFTVMETGGMKGKRKELLKSELHDYLKTRFNINHVHSEYGMTELLSQGYMRESDFFETPPWLQFQIREVNDPLRLRHDTKTGGINVIDLTNVYSCSFIATQDLGRFTHDKKLQLMGRFDNSDVRGCNLMVE